MTKHAPQFPATKQELFDTALAHVRTTRQPSMTPQGGFIVSCSYQGCGCAMAPFAPSDEAKKAWDDLGDMKGVINKFHYEGADQIDEMELLDFVSDIQQAHDSPAVFISRGATKEGFMPGFERAMNNLADEHGLTYTPELS